MKKSLLSLSFILVAVFVSKAQIQKGNVLIGADLSNFRFDLDNSNFDMRINPKAAWFIRDNVALGSYLDFQLSTGSGTSIGYGVGALGRYYVNDPSVNVLRHSRFFGEATVGIQGDNPANGDNTNGLGIGFGPGLSYFITPNIGLEGLLKYDGIIGFGSSVTSSNLVLSLGFQIYLSRHTVINAATNSQ
jgi:hypothetical protein